MELPELTGGAQQRSVVDTFYGYDHRKKIADGAWYDTKNMTADYYPVMCNREKRVKVKTLTNPLALGGRGQLVYIDGNKLYWNGECLSDHLSGVSISTADTMLPKVVTSMGAYIVLLPDKLYFNTADFTDCGKIEASFTTAGSVSLEMCHMDGSGMTATASDNAPDSPANGDYWIDTSEDKHSLKRYSEAQAMWVSEATCYVKISVTNIGKAFAELDGVSVSGIEGNADSDSAAILEQLSELNGSKVIQSRSDDSIVVIGFLDRAHTLSGKTIKVERLMPDLDYVIEANNRLWGCKYGMVNGEVINEIFCCALGDFKNWNKFQGISTDSYFASVGSDGEWTGAVNYLGYPIFFKENCLHKVYISTSGAHQITDLKCRGVEKGSGKSLVVVDETLLYKSADGICAYNGSLPELISQQLGNVKYRNAVAGAVGNKYYVSMQGADWNLFVYDMTNGIWMREDNAHACDLARVGNELYMLTADKKLWCIHADDTTKQSAGAVTEGSISWYAESGMIGYGDVEVKYISRMNIRMAMEQGASAELFIEYDSCGAWVSCGTLIGSGTGSFAVPVRPRRCDHFRLRLQGTGEVSVFGMSKVYELGGDANER